MTLSASEAADLARIMRSAKELRVSTRSMLMRCDTTQDADRAQALLAKQGRAPHRLDTHRLTADAKGK